jgi:sporulation protein YlmC with PRC-barrel domain
MATMLKPLGDRVVVAPKPKKELAKGGIVLPDTAEGDVIRLDLTLDELKALPEYDPSDYTAPATGWLPPSGYSYPLGGFLLPVGEAWRQPSNAGRGLGEAEGQGQLWPEIKKGTVVRDPAGDEVGVVDDLRFDPATGRLQQLVVKAGGTLQTLLGGGDIVEVNISQVKRVDEGNIYLLVDKHQLGRTG